MNTKYCLERLKYHGADSAACVLSEGSKYEMNIVNGEMTLLRTTFDQSASLRVIIDSREGSASVNMIDEASIDEASKEACELAAAAERDECNGFAEEQPPEGFSSGPESPDTELMYHRAMEFMETLKADYPTISLMALYMSHVFSASQVENTNNVNFSTRRGYYMTDVEMLAREGEEASSFNYTAFISDNLDKPIIECSSIGALIKNTAAQIRTTAIEGSFEGDIIFTPDCFGSLLDAYVRTFLADSALISGTSPLKDSLGERVASSILTVRSLPTKLTGGYFVTGDGYKARDCDIIDGGILKSFVIGRYASKKTGKPHSYNEGDCYGVDPGETPVCDMIRSVERGLLVSRFSGGAPAKNGDLNGVAKNSFYIEDGEIKYPISETMIAGNLDKMFRNIKEISAERTDFGYTILPSVKITGITITGK
ncbi:MAG: TldD/PmbA family protein [Clostridiales bacterium]|nr:TldD/PmbA family protein [Clostridiales bacterium]